MLSESKLGMFFFFFFFFSRKSYNNHEYALREFVMLCCHSQLPVTAEKIMKLYYIISMLHAVYNNNNIMHELSVKVT